MRSSLISSINIFIFDSRCYEFCRCLSLIHKKWIVLLDRNSVTWNLCFHRFTHISHINRSPSAFWFHCNIWRHVLLKNSYIENRLSVDKIHPMVSGLGVEDKSWYKSYYITGISRLQGLLVFQWIRKCSGLTVICSANIIWLHNVILDYHVTVCNSVWVMCISVTNMLKECHQFKFLFWLRSNKEPTYKAIFWNGIVLQ